jgi:hypothetical protein
MVVYSVRLRPTACQQLGGNEMKKPKKDPIREARIAGMVLLPGEPTAVFLSGQMHRGKYRFTAQQG